jgi:hypothetical protein
VPCNDSELDRLRRLREQQIHNRDPRRKNQKLYGDIGRKVEKSRQVTLYQILREFPAKWLYTFIGFFIGLVAGLALIAAFNAVLWSQLVALLILLVLTLVGRLAGAAEDWRKE